MGRRRKVPSDSYYDPKTTRERQVAALIESYAVKHGLRLSEWKIGCHNGTRSMGLCQLSVDRITGKRKGHILVSRNMIRQAKLECPILFEVCMHELAHALAYQETGILAHDEAWALWCSKLGIPARRVVPEHDIQNKAVKCEKHASRRPTWLLVHEGKVVKEYFRYPSKVAKNLPWMYLKSNKTATFGKLQLIPAT